jgi:excisionase family DNA binding protein
MTGTTASAKPSLGEGWLTTSQAARRIGCSGVWVGELAKAGKLPYTTTPLGRLYPIQAVADFAATRRGGDAAGERHIDQQPLGAA